MKKAWSMEQGAGSREQGAWRAVAVAALLLAPCSLLLSGCASSSDRIQLHGGSWTPVRVQPEPAPVFTHDPLLYVQPKTP